MTCHAIRNVKSVFEHRWESIQITHIRLFRRNALGSLARTFQLSSSSQAIFQQGHVSLMYEVGTIWLATIVVIVYLQNTIFKRLLKVDNVMVCVVFCRRRTSAASGDQKSLSENCWYDTNLSKSTNLSISYLAFLVIMKKRLFWPL